MSSNILEIYQTKQGGKVYENNDFEWSWEPEHDNRIEYTLRKPVLNGEITAYIKVDASDEDDEISLKLRGGEHTDDHPKAGCCYIAGVKFDGKPHLAKEYPRHEETPKFPNKVQITEGMSDTIGDIRDRWIGLKVAIYNIDKDSKVKIEEYIDTDGLDRAGKPANSWKLWWTAIDDGNWRNDDEEEGGPFYTTLQGHNDDGDEERVMFRIDNTSEDTKIEFASVREIDTPPIKA